jgi:hypothetical protein
MLNFLQSPVGCRLKEKTKKIFIIRRRQLTAGEQAMAGQAKAPAAAEASTFARGFHLRQRLWRTGWRAGERRNARKEGAFGGQRSL